MSDVQAPSDTEHEFSRWLERTKNAEAEQFSSWLMAFMMPNRPKDRDGKEKVI
jgi:hypothetical protein